MTTWVEWVEPYDKDAKFVVVSRLTKVDCIQWQKNYAKEMHDYVYKSDDDALFDFMTVHWATLKEYAPES